MLQTCSVPVILVLVALLTNNCEAKCRVCSSNGVACVSETEFRICSDGEMDETKVFKCPDGLQCTIDDVSVCAKSTNPGCVAQCGLCSDDLRFACIDETHFALCLGLTYPNRDFTGTCPPNQICDRSVNGPYFCNTNTVGDCAPGEVVNFVNGTAQS